MTERFTTVAVATTKHELRRHLRSLREALPREVVDARSRDAAAHLLAMPLPGVRTIALYAGSARHGELDPSVAAPALRSRGLSTVYPRVHDGGLTFHVADESALFPSSGLGVLEPAADAELASDIDAFVVPGLGFTADGARIGFGGGYYDRALAARPSALRIGYAHPEQVLSSLPTDAHDQSVDVIVTPHTITPCAPRSGAGAQP